MTEQEYKATFSRYLTATEQRLEALCDAYLPAVRHLRCRPLQPVGRR